MKINKREQKFLINAIVYHWKIRVYTSQKTCHWDEGTQLPVAIGPVCKSLIKKGLLADFGSVIQATKLADTFKCKCSSGWDDIVDDDDILISRERHGTCNGTGVLLDNGSCNIRRDPNAGGERK